MERKIGETFEFESKIYKVIKTLDSDYSCNGCAFKDKFCYHKIINTILGECCNLKRMDRKNVIFEEFKDMETKDNKLTINIPEGMEIDLQNSNFDTGVIKFKKKELTYKDIQDQVGKYPTFTFVTPRNRLKLNAINILMDVARYYNGDWKPDWDDPEESKYYIYRVRGSYDISISAVRRFSVVIFKKKEDAQAVINNPNFREILDAIFKN